jgi:hypothetical protein
MSNGRSRAMRRAEAARAREELRARRWRTKQTENRRRNRAFECVRFAHFRSVAAETNEEGMLNSALIHRAAALQAREFAYNILEQTGGMEPGYQRAFLSRLLEQPVLKDVLPEYVVKHKELELCQVVCSALSEAWAELKYGHGRDRRLARNVIEAAVISVGDKHYLKAASRCVGLNRRALLRGLQRRELLNDKVPGEMWVKSDRKRRSDALPPSTVDAVVNFWTEETRVSPCKKDVRRKNLGVKYFITHATHFLEESQVRLLIFLFSKFNSFDSSG